jgi:hypothetical protein
MLIRQGVALIHLVLSLDYEVFGNGAGDVMRDVVHPTSRLLDICERHGAKMTVMFEVGEYWAFERHDDQLRQDLGYSPCGAMKTQVIEAMERGHDVQLHLHPQWIGATYDKGAWQLQNRYWRLADLPDGLGSKDQTTSITGALCTGKRTLENMIRPVKAGYECVCFRAGGFYAQPSRDIIIAMKRVGLKADSSVVRGYRTTVPFEVDYSHVETIQAVWWTTDTELVVEGKPGENILELPVSSQMEPYWNSFKPAKLRAALRRRQIERASNKGHTNGRGVSSIPSPGAVLKKMLTKHASTFDFCKLSCQNMLERIRGFDDHHQQPVVMIGHSKDFVNDRHFDGFLAAVARSGTVRFASMSEYVQEALGGAGIPRSVAVGCDKMEVQ